MQFMYNITFSHICETIVTMEEQQVLHILSVCVCVCVCTAHAKYYIVTCGLPVVPYFSTYLTNGTTFRKKLCNIRCVFDVLYNF